MKVTDLMIGYFVKCREQDCGGHRVDYISEMDDEVGVDGEILDLNMIAPIPLTPEILEKNGFNQVIDSCKIDTYHDRKNGINICMFSIPEITIFQELSLIKGLRIRYVHELQHVLKLCRISKEIIL